MATRPVPRNSVTPDQLAQAPGVDAQEAKEAVVALTSMRAVLAAQPKVRIRLQEDTFVGINGYNFRLAAKEWVEVPQSVADILEQAQRF